MSIVPPLELDAELQELLDSAVEQHFVDLYPWLDESEASDRNFYLAGPARLPVERVSADAARQLHTLGRLRYLIHRNYRKFLAGLEEYQELHRRRPRHEQTTSREQRTIDAAGFALQGLHMYLFTPQDPEVDHLAYSRRMTETLEQAEMAFAELGHQTLAQMSRDRRAFGLIGQGLDDIAVELTESGASIDGTSPEEVEISRLLFNRSPKELLARNRCVDRIVKMYVALEDRQPEVGLSHRDTATHELASARWIEGCASQENVSTALSFFSGATPAEFIQYVAGLYSIAERCELWEYRNVGAAMVGTGVGLMTGNPAAEALIRAIVNHHDAHPDLVKGPPTHVFGLATLLTGSGRHDEAVEELSNVLGRLTSPSMLTTKHQLQEMLYANLRALGRTDDALAVLDELYQSEKELLRTRGKNRARLTKRAYEAEIHRLRYIDLEAEKRRTDAVLHAILPERIVAEVKEKGSSTPERFDEVSVLFADFVGYTAASAGLDPQELLGELTEIFSAFDRIMLDHGADRIKTIGDGYMAAAGVPERIDNHAERLVDAALAMIDYLDDRRRQTGRPWQARFGVNSGSVIAGIVGTTKYAYDIFGDTVNVASRLESAGVGSRVNVSEATVSRLPPRFQIEARGPINVKGKGELPMYFVRRG